MAEVSEISKLIEETSPYYSSKKKRAEIASIDIPAEEHKIVYDSSSETLEPVYYWLLDKMNEFFSGKVEKLVDNFISSPGGGHFEDMMRRAQSMQQMGSKILADVNVIIKSIINLIYDLKEWEIRLGLYDALKSQDKEKSESAKLSLKQIWMDNVDIKRGIGSINQMTRGDLMFTTLRDAFMYANKLEDVDKLDYLNDRVKRVLKPRLEEFFLWLDLSEKENRKRYQIELSYLKSQVAALKMYSRWARPYLKAAADLEQKESGGPGLVKAFNTILLELSLFAPKEMKIPDLAKEGKLPRSFKDIKLKRKYYSCCTIEIKFRGIPQKAGQHYVFGGKAEVVFKGYALNEDEISLFKQKLEDSDIKESLKLVKDVTTESLDELQKDIDHFINKEEEEKKKKELEKKDDTNPFSALLSIKTKDKEKKADKKEEKKEKIKEVKLDSYEESMIRAVAETTSRETCYKLFDLYKKTHAMPSHPSPEYETDYEPARIASLFGIRYT